MEWRSITYQKNNEILYPDTITLSNSNYYSRTAIWRFKEENRALMRRLYGEMDSPTLYREMRSTADKSSNNFHSSKHDGRNTKKTTKVIINHYVIYFITMKILFL